MCSSWGRQAKRKALLPEEPLIHCTNCPEDFFLLVSAGISCLVAHAGRHKTNKAAQNKANSRSEGISGGLGGVRPLLEPPDIRRKLRI